MKPRERILVTLQHRKVDEWGAWGYMLASCNSTFKDTNPVAVAEMFRFEEGVGFYA